MGTWIEQDVLRIGLVVVFLAIVSLPSYFISTAVYKRLARGGNTKAPLFRVLIFIASFLLIAFAIIGLFLYNVRFQR